MRRTSQPAANEVQRASIAAPSSAQSVEQPGRRLYMSSPRSVRSPSVRTMENERERRSGRGEESFEARHNTRLGGRAGKGGVRAGATGVLHLLVQGGDSGGR